MRPLVRRSLTLPLALLAGAVVAAWLLISPAAALALIALAVLEIAMAADSSVPMAGIASRIHHPARRIFLSVGLVAGVLAMRLILPPAAVAVSLAESPADAAAEAVLQPSLFAEHLAMARPGIAAFGAVFIWLVFSEYLFNVDRAPRRAWLGRFEAVLADVRFPRIAALTIAAGAGTAAALLGTPGERAAIAVGGATGLASYLGVKLAQAWAKRDAAPPWRLHVHAATVVFERGLTVFMLFEILDGAYTLSSPSPESGLSQVDQALVAAGGVGVGAVFLARLTATVDSHQGLTRLRYLKAGAAYVLGVLSVLLWASLAVPIPAAVAGWFGSLIIGAALLSSLPRRRRGARAVSPA
ncbi:hypothetical protein EDF46_2108 [Frondihabitans sp. PhB188]|uniref:DUF475 domain-containing protein n=1 Tax=Frondihabitans sp. PhB188 TaxID=2485200 RepID=UPI000F9D0527|nr:DUF475 domain-containing protein [Frondihabitans sp. PhB188]ROQ38470.1 hypothetical protein EDF46_2108 [Frondihabitans sp. PhB188]